MTGIPDLGLILLKLLAVVGAAAVGGVGAGLFLQILCRVIAHRTAPPLAVKLIRLLGAVAAGWLIWWWLFMAAGTGGLGGGGGWFPFGSRPGAGPGTGTASEKVPPTSSTPPPVPTTTPVRVVMLGGSRVVEQRFYLLDDDKTPRNFVELQLALAARSGPAPSRPVLEIVIYRDSVDRENPAITELKRWAEQQGYTVKFSFPNVESGARPAG